MGFSEIIGQKQLKEHMIKAIKTGNINHAYIIAGEPDCGKEFVARIFARAIQCEADTDEALQSNSNEENNLVKAVPEDSLDSYLKPCDNCHSCKMALADAHPDIVFIRQLKPTVISVEDIRSQLNSDAAMQPYHSPRKIYIIKNAEKMNISAQNALLKTLEEPAKHVVILILTSNEEALLSTIRSRCVSLHMNPVSDEEIKEYLRANVDANSEKIDISTAFARGNVGKAKKLCTSQEFGEMKDLAINLAKNVSGMDINDMMEYINSVKDYKLTIEEYLDILAVWYRDVLIFKATGDPNSLILMDEIISIRDLSNKTTYEKVENVLDAIEQTKSRLRANVSFDLAIELLFLKMHDCTE